MQRDIAAREVARSNLARVKPLAKLNALSQKDLDDAQGRFDESSATVDGAQATVYRAQLNLSYTIIPSPIDGFAAAANQMVGTYISQANANLTSVSLVTPMWVNFSLSENQLLDLRNQKLDGTLAWPPTDDISVDLILPDGKTFAHQAKVTFTAPYYNPQTGTFQIRGTFDNPEAQLKPSQYVTARVNGFSQIGTPDTAVYYDLKQYWDFWGECEKLDAPFYLHPRNPLPSMSQIYEGHGWLMGPTWAFGQETAVHALRLMGSGLFDKYPKLSIILGHMGEGLPYSMWRIDNRNAWVKATPNYPAKRKIAAKAKKPRPAAKAKAGR